MSTAERSFKTIAVVGLGYIGLPTAVTLANRGVEVIGVDVNKRVVDRLNAGKAHFFEPDLDMLLDAAVITGHIKAYTEPLEADAYLITVPTPIFDNHQPDLSFVEAAVRSVAKVMRKGDLIVLESTSPVGTTEKIRGWILEERPDLTPPGDIGNSGGDYFLAYCPERILPGRMILELVENDRIIGGASDQCSAKAELLYELFVRGNLYRTSSNVAELVKLVENAYRDVNIAFANELSVVCDTMNLDVWQTIKLANHHPRVSILDPGPGVGGHCIAIDPWFIISQHPETTPLMSAARQINDGKPDFVLANVRKQLKRFDYPKVACFGLAYKPNVDDLRESPALYFSRELARDKVELLVVEPNITELPTDLKEKPNVSHKTATEALSEADIVVFLVGHDEFKSITQNEVLKHVVIDTIGLLNKNN